MPEPESNGFVVTLNKQGYMTSTVDVYMQAFIDYSAMCKGRVVDIGAAYGVASIPALVKGAKVIANDTDERHLSILKVRTPENVRHNLELMVGSFPDDLNVNKGEIDGFLIARVLHFFSPEELVHAVKKLHGWLEVGGKVFLTAETPYLKNIETFIPVYEERVKSGNPWAGFMEDVIKYNPERGKFLPKTMLFLDPATLRRVFEKEGFKIEKLDFLPRPEFPLDMQRDGRESVGLICSKL